jgi:hypothetical protein
MRPKGAPEVPVGDAINGTVPGSGETMDPATPFFGARLPGHRMAGKKRGRRYVLGGTQIDDLYRRIAVSYAGVTHSRR